MNEDNFSLKTHITLREWINLIKQELDIKTTYDGVRKKTVTNELKRYYLPSQKTPIYFSIAELEQKVLPLLRAKEVRFNSITH